MRGDLNGCSWPASRLGEAIEALARSSGLSPRPVEMLTLPESVERGGGEALNRWMAAAAGRLGIETEPVEVPYTEVEQLGRSAGPALLRLPVTGEPRFLLLLGGRRRVVSLLGPDRVVHKVSGDVVRTTLCHDLEAPLGPGIDRLLEDAGVPARHREQVRAALLRDHLNSAMIRGVWLLRLPPGGSFWRQIRHAGVQRPLVALVVAHTVQYLLWLLSWWLIGRGALQGRLDQGWLLAWALLLLTLIPFRLFVTWPQGLLAIGVGGLLKQRLLYGALRLEPEEIRSQGAGQLLGRVIESESVESLALSGGLLGLVAGLELVVAMAVLSAGAGGWLQTLFLLGWVVLSFRLGWRYFSQRCDWTEARLGMTHDLVERMVGHRTYLAQEVSEHRHEEEDQTLERYLGRSRLMDRAAARLTAVVPRGWLVVGLLGLAPAFVSGSGSPALAVGLGGMLLAYHALQKLVTGLSHLAGAAIAWQQVAPFFRAAARPEVIGSPAFALLPGSDSHLSGSEHTVIEAHNLTFRYRERGEPIFQGLSLQICAGDRLLLEGPSGGGKSTLASLLTGLRLPEAGLILLQGLDRPTLGPEGWRQRVVAAPQFHENHILTETFAFNLLMGRHWPPQPADLDAAEAICRELGLGDLLDRMPAGLLQMVGETGWRLSHGERSRLYIARALLQDATLIILDESFAALDPENLRGALRCVLNRAATLLVIAHP